MDGCIGTCSTWPHRHRCGQHGCLLPLSPLVTLASVTRPRLLLLRPAPSPPPPPAHVQVTEGSGHVLVVAVGVNSDWGKTMALVSEAGDDDTPLQQKLQVLAMAIGKVGLGIAICCFVAQLIK